MSVKYFGPLCVKDINCIEYFENAVYEYVTGYCVEYFAELCLQYCAEYCLKYCNDSLFLFVSAQTFFHQNLFLSLS